MESIGFFIGVTAVALVAFYLWKRRSAEYGPPEVHEAVGESSPQARSRHKWYHWIIAVYTVGISLLLTLPSANAKRREAQKKIDALWKEHKNLSRGESERLSGYGYLLEPAAIVSAPSAVILQEARQGDTVTKTDGDIKLRGSTGTIGVGVGIGPIGIGGASSNTTMSGKISSTGVSSTGKDKARDIDEGQLKFGPAGLQFVGKLQVRDLPIDTVLQVISDGSVLVVASSVSSFAQRFRFNDDFEREVFDEAIASTIRTGSFPDLAQLEKAFVTKAATHVATRKSSLEEKMRWLVSGKLWGSAHVLGSA